MLRIEALRKSWPGFDLNVDLTLGDAEIGAVLGPSGSGKSSLLRLIAGLDRPDSGRILMDGADLVRLPPERRRIGMVFQDYALFPARTAAGNIAYGPAVAGLPREERNRITRRLASELGIAGLLERYPSSLSGGERQRVALARTLAAGPAVVLLDEPLSSLDEGMRKRLRIEIAERLRGSGAAALHVTHDVEEALAIADRLFLMRDGRIEASGPPETLYSDPPSAWSASFMGSGPVIPAQAVEGTRERPVARCGLGPIHCRPLSFDIASGGRYSVFFPADAATILSYDRAAHLPNGDIFTINRFTCKVISSIFGGRFRRVALRKNSSEGETAFEIEAPVSVGVSRGDSVVVEIRASACVVLPGRVSTDMLGAQEDADTRRMSDSLPPHLEP